MSFFADITIRSTVVLLIGLGLVAMLGRRSAALRHCILAAAVFASAAIIPLGPVLPSWTVEPPMLLHDRAAQPLVDTDTALPSPDTAIHVVEVPPPAPASAAGWPVVTVLWAAGFMASSGLLLGRIIGLMRASARGIPFRDHRVTAAAERLSAACGVRRAIRILETNAPDLIATWGVLRPRILLPVQARTWSDDRVETVLHHELAHIRRCDWIVQIAAEIVKAVYWFNPIVAIACRQLRRESEQACDDEVLAAGVRAPDYAAHLLALANTSRPMGRWASATPMARASTLERRIAAMLNAGLDRRALSRRSVIVATLLFAAVALPIAALRAAQTGPLPLRGAIYDASGGVLPGVNVTLMDAQEFKWQATTDSAGEFDFPPVQPGKYVLEASLMGFRKLRHEFVLKSARDWQMAITMPVGELRETVTVSASRRPPATQAQGRPVPVRVGGNIKAPKKVVHVNPIYPDSMREAGLSGAVSIEAIIGTDGSVLSARVTDAQVHPDFGEAALAAVRQWVFTPTLLNGRPVEVAMNVSVRFELAD